MLTEEQFTRQFWTNIFTKLNEQNRNMADVAELPDDFINRLDDISIEYEAAFGYDLREGSNPGVRATMEIDYGPGKHFQIDINGDCRFDKNTKIKITYVELSRVHQNKKEFLNNFFFQRLPYLELENLLQSLKNYDEEYKLALLEFHKEQKMIQLTVATIKSLLAEKFKNTGFGWEIEDFGSGNDCSFLIKLFSKEEEVSRLIVDKETMIQEIMNWNL